MITHHAARSVRIGGLLLNIAVYSGHLTRANLGEGALGTNPLVRINVYRLEPGAEDLHQYAV